LSRSVKMGKEIDVAKKNK